ncbi:hypothetical protein EYZ11_010868 [Aspergillus tanneri]|uniref:AB hydrolase-1 domain-containing protein n=1 Tax=Aspergillus tanneri TaxID=1220188 RepID=A0A4S3J488_9EURO|nr:uncharacterized protein ATNIH1004_002148 [Aspergillus tanneri]KAA8649477.1 hypothetical protein ATNIH1004_002148 [Aspergillus tanneri]THC89683.1 hypothetical protein EYZ11_010868 [Aspergillus tanneri]
MGWFFKSEFFDFEFLRVIGTAPVQGAEIGECLDAVSRIKDGDIDSWYDTWFDLARQAESLGQDALQANDREAARWAFFRASNYWRASEFFLHCNPTDPRIVSTFEKSVTNFQNAVKLLDEDVLLLQIPYEDIQLPGYLFLPAPHKRLPGGTPLLIHTGGFDSIGEELYFYVASGATARGYAVLIFDGPGQGAVLRREKKHFRTDWEVVIGKVLDYVIESVLPGPAVSHNIQKDSIAIFGASMGGYLALRGAADPRIKACVSCDGFYDLFDITRTRMPSWFINGWVNGYLGDSIFNCVVGLLSHQSFQLAWEFGHSMWVYGVTTPADVMRKMQSFTLRLPDGTEFLRKIEGAVLITGATGTMYFAPGPNAERLFAKLDHLPPNRKSLWVAEGVSLGGLQAKIGAIGIKQQRIFAWLDGQLGIRR